MNRRQASAVRDRGPARPASSAERASPVAGREGTLRALRLTISLGLLAALLIAPKLWLQHAFFAPLPPFEWVPSLPPTALIVCFAALLLLLLPIAVLRRPRPFLLAWAGLFVLRAAFDLSVWQPYFYQYATMLLVLVPVESSTRRRSAESEALDVQRLIVVCVYLWSGLNKLNYRFLTAGLEAVPGLERLVSPLASWVEPATFAPLSWMMPFVEVGIGLGLVLRATREIAAWAAIAMHAFILLAIGPLGQNHNPVVWPWNLAMIAFVVLLFLRGTAPSPRRLLWGDTSLHRVVFVLFAVCPLLSLAGLWPTSLSFRLYTFRLATADIYVSQSLRDRLPPETRALVEPVSVSFRLAPPGGGPPVTVGPLAGGLNISDWSERELGAFLPPEPRACQRVFEKVCLLARQPGDAVLLSVTPPDVLTGATRQSMLPCKVEASAGEGADRSPEPVQGQRALNGSTVASLRRPSRRAAP